MAASLAEWTACLTNMKFPALPHFINKLTLEQRSSQPCEDNWVTA